jgi:chromosome partitioning protein
MPVIAVINRKGGSGKSTLATHIAAWCAHQGLAVMLGDADRQQSSRSWLRIRQQLGPELPAIAAWSVDQKNVLRVPSGISHVVLDTPGGLHGFELAKIVMFADALVMPVCNSIFDRESAAACHAELLALPRVASGRCQVSVVGMRVDTRTRAAQTLQDWAEALPLRYLTSLRETQRYVQAIEKGQTVFDLPASQGAADVAQWQPILAWLAPLLRPSAAANDAASASIIPPTLQPALQAGPNAAEHVLRSAMYNPLPTVARSSSLDYSRPAALMPQQESLIQGGRLAALSHRPAIVHNFPAAPVLAKRVAGERSLSLGEEAGLPAFLRQR